MSARLYVICGAIGCTVDFVCRLLHLKIISLKNPLQIGLCNKADTNKSFHASICVINKNNDLEVKYIEPGKSKCG